MTNEQKRFWLQEAIFLARKSKDPSTQNAAIIVQKGDAISIEASVEYSEIGESTNCIPIENVPDHWWERPEKYQRVLHAEVGAIVDAARTGESTSGAMLFVPWFACGQCASAIVAAGIEEVVGAKTPKERDGNWERDIEIGNEILDEAGVERTYLEPTFRQTLLRGGEKIRV